MVLIGHEMNLRRIFRSPVLHPAAAPILIYANVKSLGALERSFVGFQTGQQVGGVGCRRCPAQSMSLLLHALLSSVLTVGNFR